MINFSKRLEAWVIESRRRPFRNARLKLTTLYVLNTVIILGVFVAVLGYFRLQYINIDLAGKFAPEIDGEAVIQMLYLDLQQVTALLVALVLVAVGILNYFFVRMTLRPIREFVEAQRRFISDASHELRTPLATVKTENEVALLDPARVTREEAISLLRSNVEEVDRISTILNNLLNLASFNSATGAPPFTAVNLSGIAERVMERMKFLADRKKVRLVVTKAANVLVWGNGTALEEVVSNLVKNAIQYTPAEGEVKLTIHADPDSRNAELVVRDNGIGIAPKDLPYIFEPFYRSENSLHMHQQGTGLGLPLVREIVKRHRGTIHIDSAPGKGTAVAIKLPLAPAEAPNSKGKSEKF